MYVGIHSNDAEEACADMVKNAVELAKQNDELRIKIQDVKGMQRCPRCGAEISKEFAFCNFCGAAIPVNERNEAPADGVQCPKCGAVVEKGMRFCTACGQEIPSPDDQMAPVDTAEQKSEEKKCPQCGAVIRDDSSFCSECGTKLS